MVGEGKRFEDSAAGGEGPMSCALIGRLLSLGCGAHGHHHPLLSVCSGPAFCLSLKDICWWRAI